MVRITKEWFEISDSYSPAIHNLSSTLLYRLANNLGENDPNPEPSYAITKYMEPPSSLVEKASEAASVLKLSLKVYES